MRFADFLASIGRTLSPEQLAAVYSDRSTVVSAGAGAGKTMVLSLRFLRLVMEGKAHADEILTITFTKKAAGEMYERIHRMLSSAALGDEALSAELAEHFPKARISTMDSFWSEIARTDSLRYGITRDFSNLDTADAEDMAAAIFDELQEDDGLRSDLAALAAEYSPESLLSFFLRLSVSHADILTDFSAEENMASFSLISDMIRQSVMERADSVMEGLITISEENPSPLSEEIEAAVDAYGRSDYASMPRINLRRTRNKAIGEYVKSSYRPILDRLQELDSLEAMRPFERSVSRLAEAFLSRMEEEKRRLGVLSYKDTEALARAILIDNKDVRNYYKRKFRYIMVDEFQDNNASQRDMLYLLSERLDRCGDGIPSVEETDPSKLFFVGDDKQSIYYFRGADVSVFRSLRNDISRIGGSILSLPQNFRSEPGLIERFNEAFASVFESREESEEGEREERLIAEFTGVDSSSYEADYERIVPRESRGVSPRISVALYPKDSSGEDDVEASDAEALYVASLIARMVSGDGYLIADRDGALRRPRFSDIAILLQTTKSQMPFERAFRIHGIPYAVVESASTTLDGVASDIYAFLQLLLYPNDRFAYLTLLRSPFARISDRTLTLLADKDPEGFKAFSGELRPGDERDAESYESLSRLYSKARGMVGRESLTRILDTIYYESGYHSYLVSSRELAVYEEHFLYLWTLAATMEEKGRSLSDYLDAIRPLIGSVEKMKDISIQHFSGDAVQMMTIHKSKGLEFPIVILADATKGIGVQRDSTTVMRSGLHPLVLLEPRSLAHPVSRLFSGYSRRREIAERKRALYVAATRAMDHLVLTGVEKRSSNSLYDLYTLSPSAVAPSVIPSYPVTDLFPHKGKDGHSSWYEKDIYPQGEAGLARIGVRDSLADVDNSFMSGEMLPSFNADDIISEKKLHTLFGIMVHSALEAEISGKPLERARDSSLTEDELKALEADAEAIAESFTSSSFYSEFVLGNKAETEVRFYYPDDGVVVEGSVDLLIHLPDHLLVVDYKTDRVRCPEMHKGQITKYARAMEGIYGRRCLSCVLYVRDWSRSTFWDKDGNEA